MALAAIYVTYESIVALFHPTKEASVIALIAAIVSLVWKAGLYRYCVNLAKKVNSAALMATANDHLADVYASIAAAVGIGAGLIGAYTGVAWLGYGDPIAGLIVGYFILKLAFHMAREAIDVLMDKTVPIEMLAAYEDLVRGVSQVRRIDRIRARAFGQYVLIDVRVGVEGNMTVQEAHDVSREIKECIMAQHRDVSEVLIHMNPWYEND
jgi:cation diffusion facilitator family transporter